MLIPSNRLVGGYAEMTRSLTPIDGLAEAVVQIMRLLRTGPFGHEQRAWQDRMEDGGTPIATRANILLAFERFDEINHKARGTTAQSWIEQVISDGCEVAARILSVMHVLSDHPVEVRQALFASNLLPIMAAHRIRSSKDSLSHVIVDRLKDETLQSLRCPTSHTRYSVPRASDGYSNWIKHGEAIEEHAFYRSSDSHWSQEMRSRPVGLKVTLNAQIFDATIQQRLWSQNRVKITGTLLWHPKISNISNVLLRSIGNSDPTQKSISALTAHLERYRFESTASPLIIIDAVEKSSDVSREEVQQAVAFSIDKILKVHTNGRPLGSILWNTLPAPWQYLPRQSELLADDWTQYLRDTEKVAISLGRITDTLRQVHGHGLGTLFLAWDRH